jgi:hypothetical protein
LQPEIEGSDDNGLKNGEAMKTKMMIAKKGRTIQFWLVAELYSSSQAL